MRLIRGDEQERLGATDVARLTSVEAYATLVHLAGHQNPDVAAAVVDTVQVVLARTRGYDNGQS